MAVAERGGLFTTKPAQVLVREADEQGHQLRRVVGLLDLSALGLGAIIAASVGTAASAARSRETVPLADPPVIGTPSDPAAPLDNAA